MILWLDNCVVKAILFLLIFSIAFEHPRLAILFFIAVLLTLEHLYKLKKIGKTQKHSLIAMSK